jgi:hypothetical protein
MSLSLSLASTKHWNGCRFRNIVFSSSLEFWTMDKVQRRSYYDWNIVLRGLQSTGLVTWRLLEEPALATTLQGVYSYFIFYIFLPRHVSAIAGHLQAEYTIILGSYLTHNGSVVLCYRSRLLYMLVNIAVVFFNKCLWVVQTGTNHFVVNVNTVKR